MHYIGIVAILGGLCLCMNKKQDPYLQAHIHALQSSHDFNAIKASILEEQNEKRNEEESLLITLINSSWSKIEKIYKEWEKENKKSQINSISKKNYAKELTKIMSLFEMLAIFIKTKDRKEEYISAVMNIDLKTLKEFHVNMIAELISENNYIDKDNSGNSYCILGYEIPTKQEKVIIEKIDIKRRSNIEDMKFQVYLNNKDAETSEIYREIFSKLVGDKNEINNIQKNQNPVTDKFQRLIENAKNLLLSIKAYEYSINSNNIGVNQTRNTHSSAYIMYGSSSSSNDSNIYNSSDSSMYSSIMNSSDSGDLNSGVSGYSNNGGSSIASLKVVNNLDNFKYIILDNGNLLHIEHQKKNERTDFYSDWVREAIANPDDIKYIPWTYFDVNVFFNTPESLDKALLNRAHMLFFDVNIELYGSKGLYIAQNEMDKLLNKYGILKKKMQKIELLEEKVSFMFKEFVGNVISLMIKNNIALDMYIMYLKRFSIYIKMLEESISIIEGKKEMDKNKQMILDSFLKEYGKYRIGHHIFIKFISNPERSIL